jgi:hypothetical protein
MKRGLMMILASAAIASSLLAPDVQARGGGGHMGGFGGAHIGAHVAGARIGGIGGRRTIGFGAVRIRGFGAGDVAGIHRGTGIHQLGYGTGIHRGALSLSAAPAVGQTATPNGYTRGYASAPALAEVPNSPVGGPLPGAVTARGLHIVGRDSVSTGSAVPCRPAAQEGDGTTTCVVPP